MALTWLAWMWRGQQFCYEVGLIFQTKRESSNDKVTCGQCRPTRKPKAVAWLYSFIYKLAVTDLIGRLEFYREIVCPIILQFLLFYQV